KYWMGTRSYHPQEPHINDYSSLIKHCPLFVDLYQAVELQKSSFQTHFFFLRIRLFFSNFTDSGMVCPMGG
ncbi:MAG: hypothetical protein MUP26_06615, partial [Desulfobulbaceae bacterium]|nr:hypothetical protein [Desulfobulbaceae bacterium]